MSEWSPPLLALLDLQQRLERGPKREGAFALWLTARVAVDLGLGGAAPDKGARRRVVLLAQRLAPLTVPRPLARGLTAALGHLEDATPAAARVALAQLVAPARDALGPEAAEAVAQALLLLPASRVTRATE
ncbi:MAG: hypothetical protein KA267_03710 [Gemmatimonadales bacterium]|nr:hypothetical protein [Gemmatimonadales bacterium]MBP6570822.1 hypothetical protein [Gemmatimonadales bacterium]MBP9899078.1 hypothetical protein [Gemmatimonadales bacterium]